MEEKGSSKVGKDTDSLSRITYQAYSGPHYCHPKVQDVLEWHKYAPWQQNN